VIEIVALSEAMREAVSLAERVAPTHANVLITGESGSGKDALAAFIHSRSQRAAQRRVTAVTVAWSDARGTPNRRKETSDG
jgi:DNA-binding NtrC family response regulator